MKTFIFEDQKSKERITLRLYADKITAKHVGPGSISEKTLTLRLNSSDIHYSDNYILSERKNNQL